MGLEDSLKWGMAPHSSVLAWKIPWAEEPGGLESMGPDKESDTTKQLSTHTHTHTHIHTHTHTHTHTIALEED